mgnify:CR=1 FL=1
MSEFKYLNQNFANQIDENAKIGIPAQDVILLEIAYQLKRIADKHEELKA